MSADVVELARVIAILPIAFVLAIGPGLLVVRRFGWSPLETLAASIGLSLTLVFVAAFTMFWIGVPLAARYGITAAAAIATFAVRRDLAVLWRRRVIRHATIGFVALGVWTLLLLSLVRQYGGGDWCCDWLEHYQRTRHFVEPRPDDFLYIGRYLFPVRPPLMNAVAAQILLGLGDGFPVHQAVYAILSVLLLFPCCLLTRHFTSNGRYADPRLVAILLGANPMFFMNSTFAWTKVLTAFYVLLGFGLFARGYFKGDRARTAGAMLALSAATVTHYSAAPCLLFVGVRLLAGRPPWLTLRTLTLLAAPAALLLGLWVAYTTATFGVRDGILRNPSLAGTTGAAWQEDARTRVLNLRDTFVPRVYRGYNGYPEDATRRRWLSDSVFTVYQSNAIFSIGSLNGLLAVVLAITLFVRVRDPAGGFLIAAALATWVLGVVVHGDRAESGLAMIALQPVTYLALAFLAARLTTLGLPLRRLWYACTIADVVLGIGLAVRFEMAAGEWARTPNWELKEGHGLQFLADLVQPAIPIVLLVIIAAVAMRFAAVTVLRASGPRAA